MIRLIVAFFLLLPFFALAQQPSISNVEEKKAQELKILNKLANLAEKGVEITDDSIKVSPEFQRLLNDKSYRAEVYPVAYTWEQTVKFIQNQELKKAFWYFVNLYPQSDKFKELVIKSVVAYDQVFKMDEVMINSFYTYCYLDPEVSIIEEGKPEIVRPDMLEAKLKNLKEIVGYILHFRDQRLKEKKTN